MAAGERGNEGVLASVPLGVKLFTIIGFTAAVAYVITQGLTVFKGGFYVIFLTLGYIAGALYQRYGGREAVRKVLAYTYPGLAVIISLVVAIGFFIMPINLSTLYQTRELAVFGLILLSNYTVSRYVNQEKTDRLLQEFPIDNTPLTQTWVVSLSIQVLLILVLVTLLIKVVIKPRVSVDKINLILTSASFIYYVYSGHISGSLYLFTSNFYSNLNPFALYWLFGIGFFIYSIKLKNTKIPYKYILGLGAVGAGIYFINYQLSYVALIAAGYLLASNFHGRSQGNNLLNKSIDKVFVLLYPLLLVSFPILAYGIGFNANNPEFYFTALVSSLGIAVLMQKLVINKFFKFFEKINTNASILVLGLTGLVISSLTVIFYTNNLLVKVQPNSWLATVVFTENCNNYKFDSNPLKYIIAFNNNYDFNCSWKFEGADKNLVVIGNSTAMSMLDGVVAAGRNSGWNVDSYAYPNCSAGLPESYDTRYVNSTWDTEKCKSLINEVLSKVEGGEYDAVLIGSGVVPVEAAKNYIELKEYLMNKGVPVILSKVPVPIDFNAGRNTRFFNPWGANRKAAVFRGAPPGSIPPEVMYWAEKVFANAIVADGFSRTCTSTECITAKDGVELYSDNLHSSKTGSLLIAPDIEKALREARELIESRD